MNIYNVTFIVENEIEKDWVAYIDSEILPELGKNVHQVDLLKVTFEEGVNNVQGTTFSLQLFSLQFYCKDNDMINWVKEIGYKNFTENFQKTGLLLLVNSNL